MFGVGLNPFQTVREAFVLTNRRDDKDLAGSDLESAP